MRPVTLVGLGLLLLCGAAHAAEPSAKDFVTSIYAKYSGKNGKGVRLDDAASRRRYFTPSLAKLIEDDAKAAAKRDDVPNLDGDPFVDAQDWEIKTVSVDVTEKGKDLALARVKFRNLETDVSVELDLAKVEGSWRVDEIRAPSGSLRALLKPK